MSTIQNTDDRDILTIPVIKPKVVAQLRDRVYAALSTTTFDQGKVALYLRDGDVNLHFDNGLYVALSAADFDRIVAAVAQAHEEMSA